jgi:cytochrome oxidase Cu insertion factor (SCO1/SenC/PrrC family)
MNIRSLIGKVLLGLGVAVPLVGFAVSAYLSSTDNSLSIFSASNPQDAGEYVLTAADFPEPAQTGNRVGNRVPDFTLLLEDGTTTTSTTLVEAGQPTFLFFWATY